MQFADYAHANHPPVAFIPLDQQNISAAPGDLINLVGMAADPDGNEISTLWWQYLEAGTYPKKVKIQNASSLNAGLVVPADAVSGQTSAWSSPASDVSVPLANQARVSLKRKSQHSC
jgi:hypothetical protein